MVLLTFQACNMSSLSIPISQVKPWIEDEKNGFSKAKTINNVELQASLLPPEYLALQEVVKVSRNATLEEFEKVLPNYSNTIAFNLRIRIGEGKVNIFNAPSEFTASNESRLGYYMIGFKDDVWLLCGGDTIRCHEAYAENNFNLSPYSNITLLFSGDLKKLNDENLCLVVSDRFFGTAYTNYCFDRTDITQFPKIEF